MVISEHKNMLRLDGKQGYIAGTVRDTLLACFCSSDTSVFHKNFRAHSTGKIPCVFNEFQMLCSVAKIISLFMFIYCRKLLYGLKVYLEITLF